MVMKHGNEIIGLRASQKKNKPKTDGRSYNVAMKNAFPTYKSGMTGGKPINFSDKKTKRGTITSID